VAIKPGTPARARISRKTIAQGMPLLRRTCGDLLACFLHLHARLQVRTSHRHSLRPLYLRRDEDDAPPGHFRAAGTRLYVIRHCERSGPIHTLNADTAWIASSLRSSQ
jgi:hypothetical protein